MQRRSVTASTLLAHTNMAPTFVSHSLVSRKVRRRPSKFSGMEDIQGLVAIAILTCALTGTLVFLGAKVYATILFHQQPDQGNNTFGHRHHHIHQAFRGQNAREAEADDDYDILPWNPIYKVADAMETVGDRSDEYAVLRQKMDAIFPLDNVRSLDRVQALTGSYPDIGTMEMGAHHSDQIRDAYDIYNCPDMPPRGYPFEWKLVDEILSHWPVNDIEKVPQKIHQGLCVFDYQKDYDKALRYRKAEVPFVVVNDPRVARTVERWSIPGYLSEMLGKDVLHRTEYNTNSHFLYHMPPGGRRKRRRNNKVRRNDDGRNQEEAQEIYDSHGRRAEAQRPDMIPQAIRMTYDEWLSKANKTQVGTEEEHWYFRLIGCGYMDTSGGCDTGSSEYLYDELPYFQPRSDDRNELYLGNPKEQKGIHCRFGMSGVVAENHFDAGRNTIALLGGRRRYILSHPRQCGNLALFPHGHESARHSEVDYANPDLERFPEFANDALANEVVLEAGQVLYLPVYWFHYIVSLELNFQCNTRSGNTAHYDSFIHDCGFRTGQ